MATFTAAFPFNARANNSISTIDQFTGLAYTARLVEDSSAYLDDLKTTESERRAFNEGRAFIGRLIVEAKHAATGAVLANRMTNATLVICAGGKADDNNHLHSMATKAADDMQGDVKDGITNLINSLNMTKDRL